MLKMLKKVMGIGDWGLGIGAQSPIPKPQTPFYYKNNKLFYNF